MLPSDKFNSILRDLGHIRTSFARRMGLRPEQLSRYFPPHGKQPMRPGLVTVLRIVAASRGRISLSDLQPANAPVSQTRCPFCGGEDGRAGEAAQELATLARACVPPQPRPETPKHAEQKS
jgi:hypothetical protein